mmetsp:Transcript_36375/g.47996  ORF Transcript_36375/g.47996 Transcript_36375/m.47996 type:complete len:468 (-) Transcript_36375:163-1566(-)|eukprot:CAMPEP_0117751228 /NCGR_PEP_ID=MMETSP0947-20121206/10847_1 /TAXON_ID=44440 /ORGANISM="Chattonella subsalsa, Strain CCMP2191" /LENGTH=467 /DNA_ID=CAMNT_0005569563 /DNA_START=107 /DNA_END=1510 /DNA_ORIENTATION=-
MAALNNRKKENQTELELDGKIESVEALSANLENLNRKSNEIFKTFVDFYGKSDAKMWFQQVKSNFHRYMEDDRRIFKELANLEDQRVKLEKLIWIAKRREQYASLSHEELTEIVLNLENTVKKLEQSVSSKKALGWFGCKYVASFGGYSTSGTSGAAQVLSSSYVLDLKSNVRQQLPDLPTARFRCAVAAIGSQVYVAGGKINNSTWTTAFEAFDFISAQWTSYDGIPEALAEIRSSVHGDKILVWGKKDNNLLLIFMFDMAKRVWEVVPSPPSHSSNNTQHIAYGNNKLFCQLVEGNSNGTVTAMRLFVLELHEPSLAWSEADHEFSSLRTLLSCSGCDLMKSTSYQDTIYILNSARFSTNDTIRKGKVALSESSGHNTTSFFSYCVKTDSYCSRQIDGASDAQYIPACHDDLVVFPERDGCRLVVPSDGIVRNIDFHGNSENVQDSGLTIVDPSETRNIEQSTPC